MLKITWNFSKETRQNRNHFCSLLENAKCHEWEIINQKLFTVKFEPEPPLKDDNPIECNLLDKVSLCDETESMSDSSDVTADEEDEGSDHSECDQFP